MTTNLRAALKEQYHSGLAMLAQCVERCPDDLWIAPSPWAHTPTKDENREWNAVARSFWRIAFHGAYFTHLYLGQDEATFLPPTDTAVGHRGEFQGIWQAPWDLEPYELPAEVKPCTQSEILEYIAYVDGLVDVTVEDIDLESNQSGFSWYKKPTKLSHELLNLRHLQGHVGQLSELLMLRGIDIEWS